MERASIDESQIEGRKPGLFFFFLIEAGKQGSHPLFYWGVISFGSWVTALSETSP